jgi:ubiquinone/menaquinone biosynthesis C-methylase UbiE
MAGTISRAAYALGQGARVGLYWGQYWLTARLTKPVRARRPITGSFPDTQCILADLRNLLLRNWRNIEAGYYRMPHDLAETPLNALATAGRYFADLVQVERRRHARDSREVRRGRAHHDGLPAYYLQNFHYQTDGYLSRRSAELYDHQVEVLFGGGADAMRRQALVPLRDFLGTRRSAETQLLDLACGTGRFLTFVKDNYPRLRITALDLSPAYLAKAREMLKPWSRVEFVEAPAEASGLPDRSCDVVTCIYLFHELPRKVRVEVAREIARVLKPGGKLIFLDSLQLGDEPNYDGLLEYFPVAFHEPYYADYLRQDLGALFTAAGLTVERVERAYFSRLMVLAKPRSEGHVNRSVTAAC